MLKSIREREAKKGCLLQVCGAVFRMDGGGQDNGPGVNYVMQHPNLLDVLFKGSVNTIIAPKNFWHAPSVSRGEARHTLYPVMKVLSGVPSGASQLLLSMRL